jgi:uncharacterized protein (DUF1015 family)
MMEKKDAQVKAFRGLQYNTSVAGAPETLLAPPYDVIYPDMQEELYRKNEYNVVRLILGKTGPGDTETDNRYTRSATDLAKWMEKGALIRDEKPSIYVYSQTYTALGETKTRVGFIARKKLEDFGGSVVPHENTFDGPKADRLKLTRACKCNFSPIFGLFTDTTKTADELLRRITQKKPDVDAKMDDGQTHRMWAVSDPQWIDSITALMEDKTILIADGHHRYETALNYMKQHSEGGKTPPEDVRYVLMYFTNTESEGLTVLPTHRVVNHLENFDLPKFLAALAREFEIEKLSSGTGKRSDQTESQLSSLMKTGAGPVFGLYYGGGEYALLKYKTASFAGPLDKLDVGILHNRIFIPLLGVLPQTDMDNQQVFYNIDIAKCAGRVDSGVSKLAFFLNSTPIAHMHEVSRAGLKMPQKSTYFYPKLISGLVINPLY